jgi:hypothetical protein
MDRPPARMRAAYVTGLGPVEAVTVGELPVPALERAGEAHRAVEGGVRGRIVLRVADPGP